MEKNKAIILLVIVAVAVFIVIPIVVFDTFGFFSSDNSDNDVVIPPDGDFSTGFKITPSMLSVKQGDVFDLDIMLYTNTVIDTAAVDNLTFTPGLLEIRHIKLGNLFRGTTMWMTGKDVNNDLGYVFGILWTDHQTTDVSGLFCTITFEAMDVGTAYVDITQYGIALAGESVKCAVLSNAIIEIIT